MITISSDRLCVDQMISNGIVFDTDCLSANRKKLASENTNDCLILFSA